MVSSVPRPSQHDRRVYYGENKGYNEAFVFSRLQADHYLATKQLEGRKQYKERLTIVICFKRMEILQNLLESHELGLPNSEKINILDAINFAISAWTTNVSQVSIANCFRHCKIRSNEEISSNSSETNFEENLHELEIWSMMLVITMKMGINKLVDYPGENDECSIVQSLEEIVDNIIEDPINDEAEDDSIPLEPITRKEAFSATTTTTLHNFLLQLENLTWELLDAI
ncbi:UNVERIFIED_CONTAM: hypothetical protein Sindi_0655500 [Sesamum indicum]